jgi:hypothetical protein
MSHHYSRFLALCLMLVTHLFAQDVAQNPVINFSGSQEEDGLVASLSDGKLDIRTGAITFKQSISCKNYLFGGTAHSRLEFLDEWGRIVHAYEGPSKGVNGRLVPGASSKSDDLSGAMEPALALRVRTFRVFIRKKQRTEAEQKALLGVCATGRDPRAED